MTEPTEYPSDLCRAPYPNLLEKLKWKYVRHFTDRDVPPKAWVRLFCPVEEEYFATEHTEPIEKETDVQGGTSICTYECRECGGTHRFLWGPPAPLPLN